MSKFLSASLISIIFFALLAGHGYYDSATMPSNTISQDDPYFEFTPLEFTDGTLGDTVTVLIERTSIPKDNLLVLFLPGNQKKVAVNIRFQLFDHKGVMVLDHKQNNLQFVPEASMGIVKLIRPTATVPRHGELELPRKLVTGKSFKCATK